jgi:hypothetical protein
MKQGARMTRMRIALGVTMLTAIAACNASPKPARAFSDPAVQTLYMLPVPDYYGTIRLAQQVAQSCPSYSFDQAQDYQVTEKRNVEGRGSVAAAAQPGAIDVMSDVLKREFQAKYDVTVGQDNLCAGADQEYAKNTALAAVLVPVK